MSILKGKQLSGSLDVTSSYAITASYALNGGGTVNTSSFVTTSSFNAFTQSINTATSSFATTGSNTFIGDQIITGSVNISDSNLGLQYKHVNLVGITGTYVIGDNTPATVYRFSNASSTSYNVELPAAGTYPNRIYWISRSNDGTVIGEVTLICSSNIEDNVGNLNPSFNIEENAKHLWVSDGTYWIMISK